MTDLAHDRVIPELAEHLRPVFEASPDGVYVWLDEQHSAYSDRFAALFGVTAAQINNKPDFLGTFVAEEDREKFSWHYWNRVQPLAFPASFQFRGMHRDGSLVELETDMIPLSYGGHTVAYHFVRKVG